MNARNGAAKKPLSVRSDKSGLSLVSFSSASIIEISMRCARWSRLNQNLSQLKWCDVAAFDSDQLSATDETFIDDPRHEFQSTFVANVIAALRTRQSKLCPDVSKRLFYFRKIIPTDCLRSGMHVHLDVYHISEHFLFSRKQLYLYVSCQGKEQKALQWDVADRKTERDRSALKNV